jgi:hypothetical protein
MQGGTEIQIRTFFTSGEMSIGTLQRSHFVHCSKNNDLLAENAVPFVSAQYLCAIKNSEIVKLETWNRRVRGLNLSRDAAILSIVFHGFSPYLHVSALTVPRLSPLQYIIKKSL